MQNIITIGNKKSHEFWTVRKLMRKCPLNPMLLNIYVQELEEEMEKGQIGDVVNKQKKKNSGLLCTQMILCYQLGERRN